MCFECSRRSLPRTAYGMASGGRNFSATRLNFGRSLTRTCSRSRTVKPSGVKPSASLTSKRRMYSDPPPRAICSRRSASAPHNSMRAGLAVNLPQPSTPHGGGGLQPRWRRSSASRWRRSSAGRKKAEVVRQQKEEAEVFRQQKCLGAGALRCPWPWLLVNWSQHGYGNFGRAPRTSGKRGELGGGWGDCFGGRNGGWTGGNRVV